MSALSLRAARLPPTSAELIARLAGNWTPILLYRRCMNCIVDDMYKLAAEAERSGSNQVIHLPRRVATESSILGALAPIIVTQHSHWVMPPPSLPLMLLFSKGAVVSGMWVQRFQSCLAWQWQEARPRAATPSLLRLQSLRWRLWASSCWRLALWQFWFWEWRRDRKSLTLLVRLCRVLWRVLAEFPRLLQRWAWLSLLHLTLTRLAITTWPSPGLLSGFAPFLTEPPCTTFSAAARPALRSYENPLGFDPSEPPGKLAGFQVFSASSTWGSAWQALRKRTTSPVQDGLDGELGSGC